jgi:hypothetical protein
VSDAEAPSLYQHFQDTEVTVFGMTGTLSQLVEYCPVKAEDRTPDQMDKFAMKVLQASNVEIPEQFLPAPEAVEKTLQASVSEPVVRESERPRVAQQNIAENHAVKIQTATSSQEHKSVVEVDQVPPELEARLLLEPEESEPQGLAVRVVPAEQTETPLLIPKRREPLNAILTPEPEVAALISIDTPVKVETMPLTEVNEESMKPIEAAVLSIEPTLPDAPAEVKIIQPAIMYETAPEQPDETPSLSELPDDFIVLQPEVQTVLEIEPDEPSFMLDTFEIYEPYVLSSELIQEAAGEIHNVEPTSPEMTEVSAPEVANEPALQLLIEASPPVVQERLEVFQATAEPEELIAVQGLTASIETAVAELDIMIEAEASDIEVVAEIEATIIELYDQLLQTIGIESTEEREELVKQFIAELRERPKQPETETEVSEFADDDEGTHEHKRRLSPQFSQNLSTIFHQMLGRLSLSQIG